MPIKPGEVGPRDGIHPILQSYIKVINKVPFRVDLIAGFECTTAISDINKYAGPTGGKVPSDQQSPFGDVGQDVGEQGNQG